MSLFFSPLFSRSLPGEFSITWVLPETSPYTQMSTAHTRLSSSNSWTKHHPWAKLDPTYFQWPQEHINSNLGESSSLMMFLSWTMWKTLCWINLFVVCNLLKCSTLNSLFLPVLSTQPVSKSVQASMMLDNTYTYPGLPETTEVVVTSLSLSISPSPSMHHILQVWILLVSSLLVLYNVNRMACLVGCLYMSPILNSFIIPSSKSRAHLSLPELHCDWDQISSKKTSPLFHTKPQFLSPASHSRVLIRHQCWSLIHGWIE